MKHVLMFPLYAVAVFSQPVLANEAHHGNPQSMLVAQAAAMTEGEVRKVDAVAKKITLKHGPIVNLDMPGMTMVFHVKEPAMLDRVKAGDKVRFSADKIGGNYTVTKIEAVK